MTNAESPEVNSAMTYSEMMNEGRQKRGEAEKLYNQDLEQRLKDLERKVDHLQEVIQRQIHLGKMTE